MRTVLAILLLCSAASAQRSIQDSFDRLTKVSYFAIGGVGIAGITSEGEKDFRLLLAEPNARELFEELYLKGNRPAKAYALLGMHRIDPKRYEELVAKTPADAAVKHFSGCIGGDVPFDKIIEQISGGVYDRR